jgi:hypothetical protein
VIYKHRELGGPDTHWAVAPQEEKKHNGTAHRESFFHPESKFIESYVFSESALGERYTELH